MSAGTGGERLSPAAWVLCADERLRRFFEIELAHLGLQVNGEMSPDSHPCLVVADTDAHSVGELLEQIRPLDCPLLAFGYEPADIPEGQGLYLRRPFPLAALESALRRLSASAVTTASPLSQSARPPAGTAAGAAVAPSATASDAMLWLEPETLTVRAGDFSVTLTAAEWAILRCLYDRRGEEVSREELGALLGGGGNSVEVYVCHLRRKIEKPLGRRMIVTLRGRGYRWT